jgi:hypothetical protein
MADPFIFVGNLHPTGSSCKEAWQEAHRAASKLNYQGIQDAPQKQRASSQSPGAWAGSAIRMGKEGVHVLTSHGKWDKAKRLLEDVWAMLEYNPGKIS